nr:unnamed protein product [Digitaria exilis]
MNPPPPPPPAAFFGSGLLPDGGRAPPPPLVGEFSDGDDWSLWCSFSRSSSILSSSFSRCRRDTSKGTHTYSVVNINRVLKN